MGERVERRRIEADRLASEATRGHEEESVQRPLADVRQPSVPPRTGLVAFVKTLPTLGRLAYEAARPGWKTGVTAEMMESSYCIIEALEGSVIGLARYYPHGHFDVDDLREYFSEVITPRFRWHRYHHSTEGNGWSATIVGPLASAGVIDDVEETVGGNERKRVG